MSSRAPVSSGSKKAAANFLDEPRAGRLTIGYSPGADDKLIENPPRFSWLPVLEDGAQYVLRVSSNDKFPAESTTSYSGISLNFHTPDQPLPPGSYFWSYAVWCPDKRKPITDWSQVRTFELAADLPETPLATRATRYANAPKGHPRLWLDKGSLASFQTSINEDPGFCAWDVFLEKSVLPWMDREILTEPKPYPNNQRTPPVWRQTYIDCQEVLYAIRHLAIAGKVRKDAEMVERAKAWLLEAASWDPDGTTSRAYTDEWAFRINLALAWGYDWLHDVLTEEERTVVRAALLARTRQIAVHVMLQSNIHLFPFDSHAVRSVSAVLIPACIAMLDEEPEAEEWLNYSIEFLYTVYSPWGDADGGWAEGPHYWMTGMAYLIDAANLLKSFTGLDLYARPFFQKTGDFPLYTKSPDTRRATFGDDSTMGDLPCLKVGYNLRQFAGVTGNGAYQWFFEEILRNDPGTEMEFYNYGWWDLRFDDMAYRHDFPSVEADIPEDMEVLKWFRGIGWAALQVDMDEPDKHMQFVFKSSPYGSISHSHGDQNAFCLSAFGEDLAIQSGYYVAFNSSMHQAWRRQTRSKNAILINGKGQYADKDKARAMRASGQIEFANVHEDHIHIRGNATAAYASVNDSVTSVLRDIYFVRNQYFVIVDSIDADSPVSIEWLLHTNEPMQLAKNSFRYSGEKAGFYGQILWSEAGAPALSQEAAFEGVDPNEIKGLPVSSQLTVAYPESRRHRIATLLVPYPLSEPRRVFHFLDDQGYDCDLYFTDADDQSFKITVQKLAKA
ncbi:DUF4962 domain-containing protein [Granulosicoccus antarcticus]|uniref:Uncharacterized protein n=1 Tax=Granulosicoccus antarcticus IMCC3135 TaxID=1192854 RepID=A0A2Z2NWE4_9GAMM|nr:DUF4962 domain-containing protein [Granulosicoccus antarcticus]ASJ74038.1 hypothetical protein IMCC3135_19795 [Granulosicoccus antarcticus IMCC3135]